MELDPFYKMKTPLNKVFKKYIDITNPAGGILLDCFCGAGTAGMPRLNAVTRTRSLLGLS